MCDAPPASSPATDDDVLRIGVGMVPDKHYRVRIGRVREWLQGRT
jgi:hypothetical protein